MHQPMKYSATEQSWQALYTKDIETICIQTGVIYPIDTYELQLVWIMMTSSAMVPLYISVTSVLPMEKNMKSLLSKNQIYKYDLFLQLK